MARVQAFKEFIIPEGSYVFQILKEPFNEKLNKIYDIIKFPLKDTESEKEYEKFFFLGSDELKEFLKALEIPVDADGSFDGQEVISKLFRCSVKHSVLKNGKKTDVFSDIQTKAWDE